jgi:transposase
VLRHLSEALDKVRKSEYHRLAGQDRRFIKGQKYTLLAHWEKLSLEGKTALQLLFQANRRLNKAYLLKESFDQLWDYWSPGWGPTLLRSVAAALHWQRLERYEKSARLVDSHWEGIALYCQPKNKIALGSVESSNAAPTASGMRSTCALRSSRACCPQSEKLP